jgi:hypothetical protein
MMTQYDEILALRDQRDDLVAALEDIAADTTACAAEGNLCVIKARAALAKVQQPKVAPDMRGWIAGPFGHCYKEDAGGLRFACPQNSDGTPDDREDAICCVTDWEDNEARNTAHRWWAAR